MEAHLSTSGNYNVRACSISRVVLLFNLFQQEVARVAFELCSPSIGLTSSSESTDESSKTDRALLAFFFQAVSVGDLSHSLTLPVIIFSKLWMAFHIVLEDTKSTLVVSRFCISSPPLASNAFSSSSPLEEDLLSISFT